MTTGEVLELFTYGVITTRERKIMDEVSAKIVLAGPPGQNKADIANMLIQGDILDQDNRVPDRETCDSEKASVELVDGRGWSLYIVDGMQDLAGGTSADAATGRRRMMTALAEGGTRGFHLFCLVLRKDNVWSFATAEYINAFRELFVGGNSRFVLIISDSGDQWVKDHQQELESRLPEFTVVAAQFLFDISDPYKDEYQRAALLQALEETLSSLCGSATVPRVLLVFNFLGNRSTATSKSKATVQPASPSSTHLVLQQNNIVQPPRNDIPVYNILLLGQTQSGKSTFLEYVRQYADPSYRVQHQRIGDGLESHTHEVLCEEVITNLPHYVVFDKKSKQELDIAPYFEKPEKYKAHIKRKDGLELRRSLKSDARTRRFRLFDTPGLNDTNGNDVQNVYSIISALSQNVDINLILIVDYPETGLTPEFQQTLRNYNTVFLGMQGIMAFVHTRVPNIVQDKKHEKLRQKYEKKKPLLDKIMGRNLTHHAVDCDFTEDRPVHLCYMRNQIKSILELATFYAPVRLNSTKIYKIEKMRTIDNILGHQLEQRRDEIQRILEHQSMAVKLRMEIVDTELEIARLQDYILENDTDAWIPIYEDRFDQNWHCFYIIGPETRTLPSCDFLIDRQDVLQFSVSVIRQDGGKDSNHWDVTFKRSPFEFGLYHVKMYSRRRTVYRRQISLRRTKLCVLQNKLRRLIRQRTELAQNQDGLHVDHRCQTGQTQRAGVTHQQDGGIIFILPTEEVERQMRERTWCLKMIDHLTRSTLTMAHFRTLAAERVYDGRDDECVNALHAYYLNKADLDD
ncbi:hypothetical protein BGX28_000619 [Mortierella sp. GBA30]|nr:hypothetical protein BGX28_000619 [Mortierella sp. GBA30]